MHAGIAMFPAAVLLLLTQDAPPTPPTRPTPPRMPSAVTSVRGTVFDSIARTPLAGAAVQFSGAEEPIVGRTYSAVADSGGHYSIDDVLPGRYVAGFFHPAVDSLGIASGTKTIVIRGSSQVVALATPSVRTIAGALCPEGTFGDSLGMLVGFVRATGTGAPLAGATVTAGWAETVIQRNSISQREPAVTASADSNGWFGMCALPTDVPLMVRGAMDADTSGYVEVTIAPGGLRHQMFHVGGAEPLPVELTGLGDSTTLANDRPRVGIWRGAARAVGVVRDAKGAPMLGARVLVWGAGMQDTTNDRGMFALEALPGGTQTLEVRAIGFSPVRRVVHLSADNVVNVTVALTEPAVALPTVTVRGELVYFRQLAEFERRSRGAVGKFITSEEISRRSPGMSAITLLQGVSGVDVVYATGVGYIAIMKGHQGAPCAPLVYIDGRKAYLGSAEVGQLYLNADIAAVEVYPRVALVPPEFQEIAPSCGVVAFWTRPPGAKVRERR